MSADPYRDFIARKVKVAASQGFDVAASDVNPLLTRHQPDAVRWACSGGRRAAAARAEQAARPAAPAYRPVATSSGPAANAAKASGRTRHRLGEMNGTEQSYALHLQDLVAKGEVVWWTFEAIRLRLADKTTLTVDFFVMRAGGALEAHELKGKDKHWEDDARVKIKVAAELYPFQFYGVHRAGGEWQYEAF